VYHVPLIFATNATGIPPMSLHHGTCLPPSSSLPPVRSIVTFSEEKITYALRNLQAIYCPLRLPLAGNARKNPNLVPSSAPTPALADSGYVSQDEDEEDEDGEEVALAVLRADTFERNFAVRWLTTLIARAEEMNFSSEDVKDRVVNDAAFILSSFSDSAEDEAEQALTRDFSFTTSASRSGDELSDVKVTLNDAPLSGTDHTDVGLQSWGASIILSGLMCADPRRFDLETASTIIELGAGTGLISLTLAKLLDRPSTPQSRVIATDYHPAVLENLRTNISTNFRTSSVPPVQTALLDWSSPDLSAPLDHPANILIAADVVYAPQHAAWLRDCAAKMLAHDGLFWLMVTVRTVGKFEGIPETVEAAFIESECPRREDGCALRIIGKEWVEKRRGIGRGDESGYNLYKIGWA
jgi:predicted nicotinamide N-methyase